MSFVVGWVLGISTLNCRDSLLVHSLATSSTLSTSHTIKACCSLNTGSCHLPRRPPLEIVPLWVRRANALQWQHQWLSHPPLHLPQPWQGAHPQVPCLLSPPQTMVCLLATATCYYHPWLIALTGNGAPTTTAAVSVAPQDPSLPVPVIAPNVISKLADLHGEYVFTCFVHVSIFF